MIETFTKKNDDFLGSSRVVAECAREWLVCRLWHHNVSPLQVISARLPSYLGKYARTEQNLYLSGERFI